MKKNSKIRVCYVLSYYDNEYVRTRSLIAAIEKIEDVELLTAINSTKGPLRYAETLVKLLYIRLKRRPDVYILGFRGYELFFPVRALTLGKKLIYDEFINLYEVFVEEKKRVKKGSFVARLVCLYSKLTLLSADKVITDTMAHAQYSAALHDINLEKFKPVYVGTDESVFVGDLGASKVKKRPLFSVFFYGNMHPLHGIEVILEAAQRLLEKNIMITIVGGKGVRGFEAKIHKIIDKNKLTNVIYLPWVDFESLPGYIRDSDLCLGGPFADTLQAHHVITGKTFQFLSMGKPVIIGGVDDPAGFVDKKNVLIVKHGDAEELSRSIAWGEEHREELLAIGREGKKLYESSFSTKCIAERLHQIILEATI